MNNSLKKRFLSVVMAAVMVFSMLPATAWAEMAEGQPAASGQTRTGQKKDGNNAYIVTQDVKSGAVGAAMKLEQDDGSVTYYDSYVEMWESLKDATEPVKGTLTLLQDVSFDKKEQHGTLRFSGDLTLDLHGNTLSCTDGSEQMRTLTLYDKTEGSTMTIIDSVGTGTSTVNLFPAGGATLIIKSGTFKNPYAGGYAASVNAYSNGAKLRIEGGTLETVGGLKDSGGTLELAGGTITEALCRTVFGEEGIVQGDLRELLAEGYIYRLNGTPLTWSDLRLDPVRSLQGTITVAKCTHESVTNGVCDYCNEAYEATVTDTAGEVTSYKTFEEAVEAAASLDGCTVKLVADATVAEGYAITAGTFTIDFNGKKITVAGNDVMNRFYVKGAAAVTLVDSADIKSQQVGCRPTVTEGGRLTVNSGEFGIGVVKYSGGTLLLNGGYFGMIALMDQTESVMALLGAGKTYWCIQGDAWGNDSNTISEPDRKILQEVRVVDVPLSITRQVPEDGALVIYDTAPDLPELEVAAAYDTTKSETVVAKLCYRASDSGAWSDAAAPVVEQANGTVTVTGKTAQEGQYKLQLTYCGYQVESQVFTATKKTCAHTDIDGTNGVCGTCRHPFVATLTAPDKTVTGYDKFSEALAATSISAKNADSADDYVLNLWQSVDCKNEQGYTTTYYYTPVNAIFTLNGNNKSIGNTRDNAPYCFLVRRGEVTLNNCTFKDNKVELAGGTMTIQGCTFNSSVTRSGATTIEGCTFNSSVTLSGGGGFNDTADVNNGTFKGEVTIQSGYVRVMGGTFEQAVTIKSGKGYTINDGLFEGVVTAESGAVLKIYAGTFSELTAATGGSEGVVLWGGTYNKVTNQGGMASLLLGGYTNGSGGAAYVNAADENEFKNAAAAAQSTLTGVKVINHFHSVDETTGTCACGESFMASVNNGTSVIGYKTLAAALDAVKTSSANAQNATKYTVKVYGDVTEEVNITGGKVTLDLNGKSVGTFADSDSTAFTVSGSAEVILTGGSNIWYGMQIKDKANLTVNSTKELNVVELYDNASLTVNGASIGRLKNMEGAPAATVNGGTITQMTQITYMTIQAGTVELTGNVTVRYEVKVPNGSVLTVSAAAQGGEPEFEDTVTIQNGGKLVASAGEFESEVVFNTGAEGELSGGTYGYIRCSDDQLLRDMLKTGYAFFVGNQVVNGYVTSLTGHTYTVTNHNGHSYEWDTTTHEKKCACGAVSETDKDAPVISFLNGAEIKTENGQQVMDVTDNVSYTVTDTNRATVTVSYDNGAATEVHPDAGGRYELLLSEGDGKRVTITATDEAGNVTTVAFTLYRLVEMRVIEHVGVAVDAEDLNRTVRNGQTYTLRVTMLPGYTGGVLELAQGGLTTKKPFTGSDAAGYTVEVTADFSNSLLRIEGAYDNTLPTAEITIQNSSFRNFDNRTTLGLFFKGPQTVNVTAADVGAGLEKAEYLLSDTAFTDAITVETADGWTVLTLDADGRGSFTVDPNSKRFIYVKATDKDHNVTVVNADGVVVYTDAEQVTESISFTRTSTDDCVFYVKDNGNTVKSITMDGRELVKDTEYRVGTSANGQLPITLPNNFLQGLAADSYTLTVTYNPLGETYVSGGGNQEPAATTVELHVRKAVVDATIGSMDKTYDREPVTPSATTESGGAKTWEFKLKDAEDSAYTTTAPKDAGTYNVRLTVAETELYDSIVKVGTFTISPKEVELHTPALEDKTYDGSTSIVCKYGYPDRAIEGKISGDDLSVVMGKANADSPDVGHFRTVTFTGFSLTGSDASNYSVKQPVPGKASITVRTLTIDGLTVSDKFYDGLNTAAIEGTPTLANLADGESLTLHCGTPTFDTVDVGGSIPVSFTEFTIADSATGKASNYILTQPTGITASIKAYAATGAEYTATTGEWTNQDFVVTAADGWQVSATSAANGDWRDSLTRSDETGTGSLTFYVKNAAEGYISEAVTLTYKIDKTNPTGEIRIDGRNAWQSFWNTISFNLFYRSEQTMTLTAADEASGVAAIEYLLSEEDYNAAQLDGMTFRPYTAPVAITPDSKLVAYARLTDAAGNVTYLRSDGVVLDAAAPVITGVDDGAVYCGSVTFTVTDAYLDTVTVDGAEAVRATTRTAGSTYVIEADSQLHTIVATDRAGNSTRMQITVNDGHTVGTPATCKDMAVCKYCGESFGDLAPDNHDGLRRVAKVNATSAADGNIEYWYCSGCGKYYLDAAATKEITYKDTILPAIGLRIVDDVKVWSPGDKPLGVIFHKEYDRFTVQIDGVTVDPANYDVTTALDTGELIITFHTPFLRTLAFGEHTVTILSDDGSASVSFKRDKAYAGASGGKVDAVESADTGDSFPMGGMTAALFISGGALALMSIRTRRKEEEA